jgi:beta-hydroxylase
MTRFFSPDDYPFLEPLRAMLPAFREEASRVVEGFRYLRWRYGMFERRPLGYADGARASFCWRVYGVDIPRNAVLCPRTAVAVGAIPGLFTSGYYLLDAGAHIHPHVGVSSDVRRTHLGIFCPPGCWLRVEDEVRTWRDGEFLVFDDTYEHEVRNESAELRCILLVDFVRPDFEGSVEGFCSSIRERFMRPGERGLLRAAGAELEDDGSVSPLVRSLIDEHGLYFL